MRRQQAVRRRSGDIALEKQGNNNTAAYTYDNGLLRRECEYPLFDGHGARSWPDVLEMLDTSLRGCGPRSDVGHGTAYDETVRRRY